ncbi:MAG: isoprenylcysteine carboxylmethyltransferase family protein [Anaerolineales bacterium]
MIHRIIDWSKKEYPLTTRIGGTLLAGLFFIILLPTGLVYFGSALDRSFSCGIYGLGKWPLVVGIPVMSLGGVFAIWSIVAQILNAGGTPLPMMATQELLVSGPFKLCRNPMTFGTILLYLGIGIIAVSPGTLAIVLVLSGLLLLYIKRIEEVELEARFGEAYRVYKERTPFLVPHTIKDL